MTFWDLWDRAYWAFMIVIGVGLLWIIFVEPYGLACMGPGLIVGLIIGGIFLYAGVRSSRKSAKPPVVPGDEA